jgi:hypothetical protein
VCAECALKLRIWTWPTCHCDLQALGGTQTGNLLCEMDLLCEILCEMAVYESGTQTGNLLCEMDLLCEILCEMAVYEILCVRWQCMRSCVGWTS